MSFISEAGRLGRRPFTIVEIDLETCTNTFGESPCTAAASIGKECFNTFGTCGDTPNFASTIKTHKFSDIVLPGKNYLALIESVNVSPTEITPGKGLGVRANATITFKDTLDDDWDDPYRLTRDYIARENGTYWGKFFARNPYYYSREVRVKFGFLDDNDDITNVETYTYLCDTFSFDNRNGKAKLLAKDILTLGDALKSKIPKPSLGKLTADMADGTDPNDPLPTTFTVGTGEGAEYPASGRVDIGDEIISFTRVGDVFTIVSRAIEGSLIDTHSQDDTVQLVKYWELTRVDEVLRDILEDEVELPSAIIPFADWQAEADQWLGSYLLSANITKPVEANKLLSEIVEQCGLAVWSDDRDGGMIKMKAEAPLFGDELLNLKILTDEHLVKDSLKITDDVKGRISSVWFSHTLRNPKEGVKKKTNFSTTEVITDSTLYSDNSYRKEQIKEIFSRWIRASSPASVTAGRLISRFGNVPKRIEFQIDPSSTVLSVGDHFFLETADIQNADGSCACPEFQVTSIDYDSKQNLYKIKALQFRFSTLRGSSVAPIGQANYLASSEADQTLYGFIAGTDSKMSNGDDPYVIL